LREALEKGKMAFNILDFLGDLSGYKQKYERCSGNYAQCTKVVVEIKAALDEAKEIICQLELMVPRPAPPALDYIIEKDDAWVEAQLHAMNLDIVRLRLDTVFKLTNRKNWVNKIVPYDLTDQLPHIKHIFDCEDFTFLFKVRTHLDFGINQMAVILDYKSGHAYGLVLFDQSEHMIQEIQTDGLYLWTKRIKDFYPLEGAVALI